MANIVQDINPSVLRWARERKHYTLADIVEKLNSSSVTDDVFMGWEEGRGGPTYAQLEKLGHYYAIPIAVFFFPEPPSIEDATVSFRGIPGLDLASISPETMNVIHRVQATQITLKELNDGVNPISSPLHKVLSLNTSDRIDADTLIKSLRTEAYLNVTLNEQKEWGTYMEALEGWRDAIEKNGIFVFRWPFKSEYLSGFCLYDEEFPVICLDSQENKGRQIFTLLHELMHLLNGESSVTLGKDGLESQQDNTLETEYGFDNIAGSILVPTDDLEKQVSHGDAGTKDFYINTSKLYKVNPRMLLVRCRFARLISHDVFVNVRDSLGASSGNGEKSVSGGGNYYSTYLSYWGKAFLHNVLSKRYQNKISEYEMSRILNMKIKNIETLEGHLINKL